MKHDTFSRSAEIRDGHWTRWVESAPVVWAAVILSLGFVPASSAAGLSEPCLSVEITVHEQTTVVFADGFESGDISPWLDSTPSYSALEISDIIFDVTAVGVFDGDSVLELKIVTPNGHLYQVLTAPVSSDRTKAAGVSRVVGYPYALQVQHMESKIAGETTDSPVTLRFPVGGTLIVRSSLYGLWEVSAYLDGVEAGCSDPSRFTLVQ